MCLSYFIFEILLIIQTAGSLNRYCKIFDISLFSALQFKIVKRFVKRVTEGPGLREWFHGDIVWYIIHNTHNVKASSLQGCTDVQS